MVVPASASTRERARAYRPDPSAIRRSPRGLHGGGRTLAASAPFIIALVLASNKLRRARSLSVSRPTAMRFACSLAVDELRARRTVATARLGCLVLLQPLFVRRQTKHCEREEAPTSLPISYSLWLCFARKDAEDSNAGRAQLHLGACLLTHHQDLLSGRQVFTFWRRETIFGSVSYDLPVSRWDSEYWDEHVASGRQSTQCSP